MLEYRGLAQKVVLVTWALCSRELAFMLGKVTVLKKKGILLLVSLKGPKGYEV